VAICTTRDNQAALELVAKGEQEHRTTATLFLNGNYRLTRDLVPALLRWRTGDGPGKTGNLHMVVGARANITRFAEQTHLTPKQVLRTPASNSFSAYSTLGPAYKSFHGGDIVVLCSGVLGRFACSRMGCAPSQYNLP